MKKTICFKPFLGPSSLNHFIKFSFYKINVHFHELSYRVILLLVIYQENWFRHHYLSPRLMLILASKSYELKSTTQSVLPFHSRVCRCCIKRTYFLGYLISLKEAQSLTGTNKMLLALLCGFARMNVIFSAVTKWVAGVWGTNHNSVTRVVN